MQAVQTEDLELIRFTRTGVADNAVDAAWPVHRDTGAASAAALAQFGSNFAVPM